MSTEIFRMSDQRRQPEKSGKNGIVAGIGPCGEKRKRGMAAPQPEKKSGAMAAGGEKRCLRRREVVLRNLSERKREGKKLLMADLKRMTEKATDAGAGNKNDEDADQSKNGRACGRREGDEARGCREAGDGEGGKDKVMKKAGKDKVGGEDEEGWDSGEGEEKSCRPCGCR